MSTLYRRLYNSFYNQLNTVITAVGWAGHYLSIQTYTTLWLPICGAIEKHLLTYTHTRMRTRMRTRTRTHMHTHTHTHVYRYQKGKTNLDFTEARDSVWQWHPLGHVQGCTLLKTDNHTSTPPLLCVFTGRMPFLSPNQQCQSTEGILTYFSSNASRAILTNGHTEHMPRAPGFFFFLRAPSGCGKINF